MGSDLEDCRRPVSVRLTWVAIAGCLTLALAWLPAVGLAETLYSYVDDKGNVVMTNSWDTIPEKYRARAKVTQGPDGPLLELTDKAPSVSLKTITPTPSSPAEAPPSATSASRSGFIPGLDSTQSLVVVAGLVGVVMFATLKLTSNATLKVLMKWMLVLLVLGTTAKVYFAQIDPGAGGELIKKVQGAAGALQRTQEGKAKDIERMGPGGK